MKKNNPAMHSLNAKCPLAGAMFFAIELPIIKTIGTLCGCEVKYV